MLCKKCGKEVDRTPFCPYCGSKVEEKTICKYCGQEIKGTPYCPYCGKSQKDSKPKIWKKKKTNKDAQKKSGKSVWKKIAAGVAILLILVLGIALFRNIKKEVDRKTEIEKAKNLNLTLPAPDVFLGEKAEIKDNTYYFELDDSPYEEIWEYTHLLEEKYDMKLVGWATNESHGANHLRHKDYDRLEVRINWSHQYTGITEVQVYFASFIQVEKNTTVQKSTDTRAEKYAEAVRLYEKRDYRPAKELFESLSDYADSQKYLRLIRIRFSGGNVGVGSKVYRADCALTESQKRDIDAAAADFSFADTAEVLVCNSDVASYYLIGDWNGGSKCYIHFIANDYGCRYNIGSKLSTNYQDTFAINDGIVYVDVVEAWTPTLKLTLVSPDCMEVLTYEKGDKTYVLTRE